MKTKPKLTESSCLFTELVIVGTVLLLAFTAVGIFAVGLAAR